MSWFVAVLCSLFAFPLAGCGASDGTDSLARPVLPLAENASVARNTNALVGLPATFAGVLPCADCQGIAYQLNLFPDRTYFLRTSYQEPGMATRDDIGRWTLGSDGETLVLTGDHGSPQYFRLVSQATLRKLDSEARPISSLQPHDLTREPSFKTIEVHTILRGSYVGMMETGMFTECATQRRWMVANEGGSAVLEAMFHERGLRDGDALVVSVRGQIAKRPATNGAGRSDMLVVDEVVDAAADAKCLSPHDTAPLEGTRWRLTTVRGQHVVSAPGRAAPPVLTLGSTSAEFFGSTGCNQTLGSYRRDGENLTFDRSVTTRAVCTDEMATDEAFVRVLEQVTRWRIIGRILELMDGEGGVLARFDVS